MSDVVIGEMTKAGPYDFGDRDLAEIVRDQGMDITADQIAWHIPPAD